MLSDEETRKALLTAAENAVQRRCCWLVCRAIAWLGRWSLAEYAAQVGYDAVLVQQPSVVKRQQGVADILSCGCGSCCAAGGAL